MPSAAEIIFIRREEPIHWPTVIDEIRATGQSCTSIAASLGVGRMAVKHWSAGNAVPRFEEGRALLKLHERVTHKAYHPG